MSWGRSSDREPAAQGEASAPGGKASFASVLQAPRPAITRYRPAVIGAALVAVLLLVGLGFMIAFGGGHKRPPSNGNLQEASEPSSTAPPIDDRLPSSYGALGPSPAAAHAAEGVTGPAVSPPGSVSAATPGSKAGSEAAVAARRQRLEEQRSAQSAAPFFGGAAATGPASTPPSTWAPALASQGFDPSPPSAATGLTAKESFIVRAGAPSSAYAQSLPQPPLSLYEVKAGSVIAAALITGLNSDLPGMVVAQVTQPVFDHRTGRIVLIPQGARLIGKYDSQVGYGQDRMLLVWTRLIFPSGRSMDLGAMTGADPSGAGGLSDRVDTHLPVLARAVGLSTLISIGGSAAQNSLTRGSDNLVLQDGVGGLASQASQTGQRLVERHLQRAPTLRIRPGFPVRVMVDKDLILPPEGGVQ